jgi:hypothetical protein
VLTNIDKYFYISKRDKRIFKLKIRLSNIEAYDLNGNLSGYVADECFNKETLQINNKWLKYYNAFKISKLANKLLTKGD